MEELFKMLNDMMKEVNGGGEPHMTEAQEKEVQKDIDGFKSLVSAEEHKAIAELKTAMDNLVKVHLDNLYKIKDGRGQTAQQTVHLVTYCDLVHETMNNISMLDTIDTEAVKALAELRIEHGITYERMAISHMLKNIFK